MFKNMLNNLKNESFVQNVSAIMSKDHEPTIEFLNKNREYQQRAENRVTNNKVNI